VVCGLLVLAGLVAVGIWAVNALRLSYDMHRVGSLVWSGDVERLQKLIEHGLDVNASIPNDDGLPTSLLLTTAAAEDNAAVIRLLLEAGADVNRTSGWGWTPLIRATLEGKRSNVRLLLEAGADIEATSDGQTALMHAAGGRRPEHVDIFHDLMDAGADVTFTTESGWTVLHDAALGRLPLEVLEELVARGVDAAAVDDSGITPLHCALQGGRAELEPIVAFLIARGTPVNQAKTHGMTALHQAAERSAEVVRMLLEAGADPHAADTDGWSALHHAARYGSAESVRLLLEAGVDPTATVTDPNVGTGQSVVDLAHSDLGSIVAAPEDVRRKIRLLEEALAAAEE